MKWMLVDKFDNIVHTADLDNKYGDEEARKYFSNLKRMEEKEFNKLWKVLTEEQYNINLKPALRNRQVEWWNEDNYLDVEQP